MRKRLCGNDHVLAGSWKRSTIIVSTYVRMYNHHHWIQFYMYMCIPHCYLDSWRLQNNCLNQMSIVLKGLNKYIDEEKQMNCRCEQDRISSCCNGFKMYVFETQIFISIFHRNIQNTIHVRVEILTGLSHEVLSTIGHEWKISLRRRTECDIPVSITTRVGFCFYYIHVNKFKW